MTLKGKEGFVPNGISSTKEFYVLNRSDYLKNRKKSIFDNIKMKRKYN